MVAESIRTDAGVDVARSRPALRPRHRLDTSCGPRGLCHALLLGLLAVSAASPAVAGGEAAAEGGRAGAAQVAEAQKLLAEWRTPAASPGRKREIVARLLELGDQGPRRLALECERVFRARNPSYLTKLESGAADAVKARWKGKGDIERQVADLRKTVLDVSRAPNLAKEMITGTADPAMAELDELMTITPDGVMEAKPDLKAQRQDLLDVVAAWRQAVDKVPGDGRKALGAAAAAPPDPAGFERDLRAKEELASMMATPMPKGDRDVLLANRPLAEKLDPAEARGILALNLMRVRLGIGAQAIDPRLCEAARGHSADMRAKNFFAHESPVPGKETPWKRAQLAGTTASAENIEQGSDTGEGAVRTWWHSPGHHKNMTGGHPRVGLGRSGRFWTQMFGN